MGWGVLLVVHFMWLRSTTKWTVLWSFFPLFSLLNLMLVTLGTSTRKSSYFLSAAIGIVASYLACISAWFATEAIFAPDRISVLRASLSRDPQALFMNSLFTSTFTGCLFVGICAAFLRTYVRRNPIHRQ